MVRSGCCRAGLRRRLPRFGRLLAPQPPTARRGKHKGVKPGPGRGAAPWAAPPIIAVWPAGPAGHANPGGALGSQSEHTACRRAARPRGAKHAQSMRKAPGQHPWSSLRPAGEQRPSRTGRDDHYYADRNDQRSARRAPSGQRPGLARPGPAHRVRSGSGLRAWLGLGGPGLANCACNKGESTFDPRTKARICCVTRYRIRALSAS